KGTETFKGMMDITKFIRDNADDDFLASLVLTDDGGMSFDTLETILDDSFLHRTPLSDPTNTTPEDKEKKGKRIIECFNKYGPALVSQCKIDKQFYDFRQETRNPEDPYDQYKIPFFDEYHPSGKPGTHAMVLVGYRETHAMVLVGYREIEDEQPTFLLQNWWYHMQFCEVTLEYLMACNAKISFCSTKQTSFGVGHQLTDMKFAEAKVSDRADGFRKELERCKHSIH
ncbi:MAG: hypothetical protein SGILL_003597, partial [Bacillariaceae sp.]